MCTEPKPFDYKKISEDKWEVNMNGNKVYGYTEEEAKTLAQTPVQYYRIMSYNPMPDKKIIKKIVEICERNGGFYNTPVFRLLKHWYEDYGKAKQE